MRFLTAGESHGPGLVVIADGLPRGLPVDLDLLTRELSRRQLGYGRGPRAGKEPEEIEIIGGIRAGLTTGAPVAVLLRHKNWPLWEEILMPGGAGTGDPSALQANPDLAGVSAFPTRPRPGHADLAGARKFGLREMRDVIERASARETAARQVAGALARSLLAELGAGVYSYVNAIGPVTAGEPEIGADLSAADASPVRTLDARAESNMMAAIDAAKEAGDTLGGVLTVAALGVAAGLGSYAQWDSRLDGRIAAAVMSIPSVKGVEIGGGFGLAILPGSAAHDAIIPGDGMLRRPTNRAGGLEGGISNGQPILVRAAVKPVPTLFRPLPSVDLATGQSAPGTIERSDICVVPAAAVVAEAMISWVIAAAYLEKFGGDTMTEIRRALAAYRAQWPWSDGN